MAKILVVDDDVDLVGMLCKRLMAEGFQTFVAYDALMATEQVRKVAPDLIILDVGLPAGGGKAVLDRLNFAVNADSRTVIILTGRTDPETREQFEGEEKVVAYMLKPFETQALIEEINRALAS